MCTGQLPRRLRSLPTATTLPTMQVAGRSFASPACILSLLLSVSLLLPCRAFVPPAQYHRPDSSASPPVALPRAFPMKIAGATTSLPRASSFSPSALGVTWFGGTAETEVANGNSDSCELVAVRIERTSANSRRILGEIVVPECPLDRVWSILTDYDRLSIHVPNLVESRIVSVQTPRQSPGDGSFRCRLFQKGAQKIVGFEFGASVTMDMVESVLPARSPPRALAPAIKENAAAQSTPHEEESSSRPLEGKSIRFKCYDSFFFSEFDGEWKASEEVDPATGNIQTVLSYMVDVRPKGPVPVAALEWRIREDVPTNLRAVKSAALKSFQRPPKPIVANKITPLTASESLTAYSLDEQPVMTSPSAAPSIQRPRLPLTPRQLQEYQNRRSRSSRPSQSSNSASREPSAAPSAAFRVKVNWDEDETLGAYLR